MTHPPISGCCKDEHCFCGVPATHKVEEVILFDDPSPNRHPHTTYVCCGHFTEAMGGRTGSCDGKADWKTCNAHGTAGSKSWGCPICLEALRRQAFALRTAVIEAKRLLAESEDPVKTAYELLSAVIPDVVS